MKFSSSSLFHDVEVCLSRMDLVSTALAADGLFNSRMRPGRP